MRPGWRHVFLAVVVSTVLLANGVLSQSFCSLPSVGAIDIVLRTALVSGGGEGGTQVNTDILDYQFTCLAVGARDMYRSASVAIRFNTDTENNRTTHLQMTCGNSDTFGPAGNQPLENDIPLSIFDVTTRRDCRTCSQTPLSTGTHDAVTNCAECSEVCRSSGLGACDILNTVCCSVFLPSDGSCATSCPQHFIATANSNYTCVCPIADQNCSNGGVREGVCFCNCAGTGYKGLTCSEDIDECTMSPCQHGGSCANTNGSFICTCALGYTGSQCETDIDDCASNPCVNGICSDRVNSFVCACTPGYTGTTCATDINECMPQPCRNGGTCSDRVDGYICVCASSYSGLTCETDVDECKSLPCNFGSLCTNIFGNYVCSCPPRWTGQNCELCNISNCLSCENIPTAGADCTACGDGYRKLDPVNRRADEFRLNEVSDRNVAVFLCVRDCNDNWCVDCPDRASCQLCQNSFRVTDANTCTIKSSLATSVIIAIFVSLIVVVLLVVAIVAIIAGVWLAHYNKTVGVGYRAAKKDPGDIQKELVLTKSTDI